MKTKRISLFLLMQVMLASGLLAQAQHQSGKSMPGMKGMMGGKQGMMGGGMMAHCHEMMQKHEQMQKDMKAMDSKLDGLVADMNKAASSTKADATTAVINEMVAQRKKMNEKMGSMQTGMMQHMMEHMQMGKQSMTMCPMMANMQPKKGGTTKPEDHSKHH